jgi:hypothetical protein
MTRSPSSDFCSRPIALLCLTLMLAACHKAPAPADEAADSSRGLKVESYDAPIAKAPLTGDKLPTLTSRP